MNQPITLGWTQVIILVIVVAGLGLLISGGMGLRGRREIFESQTGERYYRRRRGFGVKRGVGGVLLVAIALSLLWLAGLVQTYVSLDSKIRVAQVRANKISNQPHMMNVELTLYDQDGKQTSNDFYTVAGDRWQLQGNILKFPSWLNIMGVHSGYKLTRLQGQYDRIEDENKLQHKAIELNGGDGDFFKTVYNQAWSSPFVEAAYGNAVILPADGRTYDVKVSQGGLEAYPAR